MVHLAPAVLVHKELQALHGLVPQLVGGGVLNAALLDAHVHNVRCVLGQAQVAPGLHHQQEHNGQNLPFHLLEIAYQFQHCSVSFARSSSRMSENRFHRSIMVWTFSRPILSTTRSRNVESRSVVLRQAASPPSVRVM